jgi:hypothetical protein
MLGGSSLALPINTSNGGSPSGNTVIQETLILAASSGNVLVYNNTVAGDIIALVEYGKTSANITPNTNVPVLVANLQNVGDLHATFTANEFNQDILTSFACNSIVVNTGDAINLNISGAAVTGEITIQITIFRKQ